MSKCDGCGKELDRLEHERPNDTSGIILSSYEAWSVTIDFSNVTTEEDKKYMKRQFGDYDPESVYIVCVECYLKSLGIKPNKGIDNG